MNTNKAIPEHNRFTLPSTFDQFAKAAGEQQSGACPNPANMRILQSSVTGSRSTWLCNHNRQTLQTFMVTTRPELMEKVERCRALLTKELPLPQKPRRRTLRGREFGDAMCQDRYLRRVPECWSRTEREPRITNRVRLAVNLATPWNLQESDTIWRGAVTVALADELTKRGVQVEVIGCKCSANLFEGNNSTILWTTHLKRFSDPLNLSMLSRACCDLTFYRGVFLMGILLTTTNACDCGMGIARPMTRHEVDADILIDHDLRTFDDARARAEDFIKQLMNKSSGEGRTLEQLAGARP